MTRAKHPILAGLLWTLALSHCIAAARDTSTVELHATDLFGRGLQPIQVTRFVESRIGGIDYSSQFVGGQGKEIPFGEYVVSIRAGGILIGGRVSVYSSEVFAVLSGSGKILEYGPGAVPVLRGQVLGMASGVGKPIWVRMFNLYENDDCCTTVKVAEDQTFSTRIWDPGMYSNHHSQRFRCSLPWDRQIG